MKGWIVLVAIICIVFGFVGLITNMTTDDIAGILPNDFTGTIQGFGNLQLIIMSLFFIGLSGGCIYALKG